VACELEVNETASSFVVLPTVMAVETQPGRATASLKRSLPAAMTVGMPLASRLSMSSFAGLRSQAAVKRPKPKLRFTAAIGRMVRRL
jgi:hypothetical protein